MTTLVILWVAFVLVLAGPALVYIEYEKWITNRRVKHDRRNRKV